MCHKFFDVTVTQGAKLSLG